MVYFFGIWFSLTFITAFFVIRHFVPNKKSKKWEKICECNIESLTVILELCLFSFLFPFIWYIALYSHYEDNMVFYNNIKDRIIQAVCSTIVPPVIFVLSFIVPNEKANV